MRGSGPPMVCKAVRGNVLAHALVSASADGPRLKRPPRRHEVQDRDRSYKVQAGVRNAANHRNFGEIGRCLGGRRFARGCAS